MKSVSVLNNTVYPSKVVCIGRNYAAHIEELNNATPDEPVIFIKPNSAISNQVCISDHEVHYEGEICFLIKDKKVSPAASGFDGFYMALLERKS